MTFSNVFASTRIYVIDPTIFYNSAFTKIYVSRSLDTAPVLMVTIGDPIEGYRGINYSTENFWYSEKWTP